MEKVTPAMQQYIDCKRQYPDCIILFRMGDFYELFFEDAEKASQILGITLTQRGTKQKTPLAGMPYHALDNYLPKLIEKGLKVAICEQLEDPKLAKGVVKRGVIRVITPGTIIDSTMLKEKHNNYIMHIHLNDKNNPNEESQYSISICDISTGEFMTTNVMQDNIINEVNKWNPNEIIMASNIKLNSLLSDFIINEIEDRTLFFDSCYKLLLNHFKINSLESFGLENNKNLIISCGALLQYIKDTQMTTLSHIKKISFYNPSQYLMLDPSTIRNLELKNNLRDNDEKYTLLSVIDQTRTPMGSRLLRKWLTRPLRNKEKINSRLETVGFLKKEVILRQEIQALLKEIKDIERLIGKINYGNCNARDIKSLQISLEKIPKIKDLISNKDIFLLDKISNIPLLDELIRKIDSIIKSEPPLSVRDGGMINKGINSELDSLHEIYYNSKEILQDIELREKNRTNIKSLKIGFNKVFGYYIEITKTNSHLVPDDYIRKQTMTNAERYITEELKTYEDKILGAEEKIKELEYSILQNLIEFVKGYTNQIQETSYLISVLDIMQSFAHISVLNNYTKPIIHDKKKLTIKEGRHPVVEQLTPQFISNDVEFDNETNMMIITGPNMAGKSTVMRQTALIIILSQIGCFVPALEANIGICDQIFTRVGAHDDLTHGQSTFMVEMNETAYILNYATENSFVIMDEIGRGTSTYDGVSIAWSVAEHLFKKIKCNTMFATHYHVLTKLGDEKGVKNYNIAVKEYDDKIVFLHKLVEGGTDKSYGIHVAKLAGLPNEVIENAKRIQKRFMDNDIIKDNVIEINNVKETISKTKKEQLTLFDSL